MKSVVLGLKENWKQFTLLVLINGLVGGVLGIERTILPELAAQEFGVISSSAILVFIVFFGFSKAIANYYAGHFSNRLGRKKILILGWVIALPVPLLLIVANSWGTVLFANVLLGISQGLTWSSTVVMKIDLVGEKNRGLAMGINESVGYLSVGLVAFFTGWLAAEYGLRPYPFYLGIVFVVLGLLLSWLFVKDTVHFVTEEAVTSHIRSLNNIFWDTTWKDNNLGSITQAGMINNLNDGMIWGLYPIYLFSLDFSLERIGFLVAVYPAVWGIGQLITGKIGDLVPKKKLLVSGMTIQGIALSYLLVAKSFNEFLVVSVILGIGTAIVYPNFLAAIAEHTHPKQRANSLGVFRLWRDLGYVFGALITGILIDSSGFKTAILVIALLTFLSGLILALRMSRSNA